MTDDLFTPPRDNPAELPVEPLDPLIVADILDTLTVRQEALEHAFDTLTRRLGTTTDGPWTWRTLGPAATRDLFTQLRDWVDWLVVRYGLHGEQHAIAPCWYRHPVAVEELAALMVAWRAAYSVDAAAPSDALLAWHDRCLWPTLHRLNTVLKVWAKCTGGTHTDPRPVPAPTGPDFAVFLDQLTQPPAPPDRPITAAGMTELLNQGEAVRLVPDEPDSPFSHHGRWYAISSGTDGDAAGTWTPVTGDESTRLDLLRQRREQTPAGWEGDAP